MNEIRKERKKERKKKRKKERKKEREEKRREKKRREEKRRGEKRERNKESKSVEGGGLEAGESWLEEWKWRGSGGGLKESIWRDSPRGKKNTGVLALLSRCATLLFFDVR